MHTLRIIPDSIATGSPPDFAQVPTHFFKVIITLKFHGSSSTHEAVDAETLSDCTVECAAFLVPNCDPRVYMFGAGSSLDCLENSQDDRGASFVERILTYVSSFVSTLFVVSDQCGSLAGCCLLSIS